MRLWSRRTWLKLLLIVIAVPPLVVALRLSLNVAGFCYDEFRFISEDEIINGVIDDVYASYPPSYYEIGVPVQKPISYLSREQFLKANPDCCNIVRSAFGDSSEGDFVVPFEYSLFGTNRALVRVVYRVELSPAGSASSKAMPPGMKREYRRVTNCGYSANLL
jgi:hypothetical protein